MTEICNSSLHFERIKLHLTNNFFPFITPYYISQVAKVQKNFIQTKEINQETCSYAKGCLHLQSK